MNSYRYIPESIYNGNNELIERHIVTFHNNKKTETKIVKYYKDIVVSEETIKHK